MLDHLVEPVWEPNLVDYVPISACLTDSKALDAAAVEGCHLAVVQNCFNEVPTAFASNVAENVMSQFARLAPGGIAIVIDRANYSKSEKIMKDMHALAVKTDNIIPISGEEPQYEEIDVSGCLEEIPPIVTNNLIQRYGVDKEEDWPTDGRMIVFAKRIKYISMAFQVR